MKHHIKAYFKALRFDTKPEPGHYANVLITWLLLLAFPVPSIVGWLWFATDAITPLGIVLLCGVGYFLWAWFLGILAIDRGIAIMELRKRVAQLEGNPESE